MVLSIPITNHEGEFSIRGSERERNTILVIDYNWTKTTRSSLEVEGREVEETTDLIFDLEAVSEVPLRRDGTVRAENTVLPRVTPHLNPIPFIQTKSVKITNREKKKRKDESPSE